MIDLHDPRRNNATSADTERGRERRERAAAMADAFPARGASGLDFNKAGTPVRRVRSFGELYALQPVEKRAKSEHDRRLDALPEKLQRAALTKNIEDLDVLEAAAFVIRAIGHETKAIIHATDLGTKLGITRERADALLTGAVELGLLTEEPSWTVASRTFRAAFR